MERGAFGVFFGLAKHCVLVRLGVVTVTVASIEPADAAGAPTRENASPLHRGPDQLREPELVPPAEVIGTRW